MAASLGKRICDLVQRASSTEPLPDEQFVTVEIRVDPREEWCRVRTLLALSRDFMSHFVVNVMTFSFKIDNSRSCLECEE